VLYYVISGGFHPFGDVLRHQANIATGDYSLSALQADGLFVFVRSSKKIIFHLLMSL